MAVYCCASAPLSRVKVIGLCQQALWNWASSDLGALLSLLSVARVGQVQLFYLAQLQSEAFAPDPSETQAVRLVSAAELAATIHWDNIAFTTVRLTLEHFFADFARGQFGTYVADVP